MNKSNRCEKQFYCTSELNCRKGNHCKDFYPINSTYDYDLGTNVPTQRYRYKTERYEPLDFDNDNVLEIEYETHTTN